MGQQSVGFVSSIRLRFCMAKAWFAYRKTVGIALTAVFSVSLAAAPAWTQELSPAVLDAIRQAAEAASAPAPRLPVLPPLLAPASAPAPTPAPAASPPALMPPTPPRPAPAWVGVARNEGRLRAADIGLVINTADPYSVAVGEHYIRRRGIKPRQVLRMVLPTTSTILFEDYERLRNSVEQRFGAKTQALVLAWTYPYAVGCNSIGGALALGYDGALCDNSCQPSKPSRYFNSPSAKPYTDLGMRISMQLAAPSVEAARELIDRGALADGSLAIRDRQPVSALMLLSNDAPRAVRTPLYPPAGPIAGLGVTVRVEPAFVLPAGKRMLMAQTGAMRLEATGPLDWVPGGLGDHLTSFGGALEPWHGQGTALDWIASGATASHGTVSEPCNHVQKFPHPQLLLLHYLQGATAIEAYWKSVAWPQQSLFIGDPLAAPFAVPDSARGAATPVPFTGSR